MTDLLVHSGRRLQDLTQILLAKETSSRLRSHLVRGASGTFAIRVAATGLVFINSLVLARLLGAEGYGVYAYAMALVTLLGVPATLGLPQLIVREVAAYRARLAWGEMRGLWRRANQTVLLGSLGLALLAGLISWVLAPRFDTTALVAFWVALFLVPLTAFLETNSAILQGLQRVVTAQAPQVLVRPVLFVVLVVGAYLLIGDGFGAPWAVGMQVAASGAALVVLVWLVGRHSPRAATDELPVYATAAWARSALPFLFVGGMQVVNHQVDIVMLGALRGADVAGVYRVASMGAELILFPLVAVNMALAPVVAGLHAAGEMPRLQRLVTASARAMLAISLPIALVMMVLGHQVLGIFGQEFTQGATALVILSAGQLVNAAMGSVGLLLMMTGHERDTAWGVGIAAVVNVALNGLLIPLWGIEGAAVATAVSLVTWNLVLAVRVSRKLGIHCTALGRVSLGRGT